MTFERFRIALAESLLHQGLVESAPALLAAGGNHADHIKLRVLVNFNGRDICRGADDSHHMAEPYGRALFDDVVQEYPSAAFAACRPQQADRVF